MRGREAPKLDRKAELAKLAAKLVHERAFSRGLPGGYNGRSIRASAKGVKIRDS